MVNDICDKIGYKLTCIENIAEMLAPWWFWGSGY